MSDYSNGTDKYPGVSTSTARTSTSGQRSIDPSLPRGYHGNAGYEPETPCPVPGCSSNHLLAAWIQHVHGHITTVNPNARRYNCPCACDAEPTWNHLLREEAKSYMKQGGVSLELRRVLKIGDFNSQTAHHFGVHMHRIQGRNRDP